MRDRIATSGAVGSNHEATARRWTAAIGRRRLRDAPQGPGRRIGLPTQSSSPAAGGAVKMVAFGPPGSTGMSTIGSGSRLPVSFPQTIWIGS